MFRIVVACTGIPAAEGPSGAEMILREFSHRPWHTNVKCTWDETRLILQADNDYDSNGLALTDEFSDAISACISSLREGCIEILSVAVVGENQGRQRNTEIEILHIAKELVAGRLGVIAASRELNRLRHHVEPEVAELLLTFEGIDSETDTLPIGEVRKQWNPEALERKDREIGEAEGFYRDSAVEAAGKLIRLLDAPFSSRLSG